VEGRGVTVVCGGSGVGTGVVGVGVVHMTRVNVAGVGAAHAAVGLVTHW
jgi:hypothetical protein